MSVHEPIVTLSSGVVVLQAVWDTIASLHEQGRTVFIDDERDAIIVRPLIHPRFGGIDDDVLMMLANNQQDVCAILAWQARVH